jgi:hypothetical protein
MKDLTEPLIEVEASFSDGSHLDAFGRLKVAEPQTLFDAQLTYDLQPLLYEQIKTGAVAETQITHDSTNRRAQIIFNACPTGKICAMQTYEHFRYQPGKSHEIFITFNFGAAVTNTRAIAGYYDSQADTGFFFSQESAGGLYFNINSATSTGDQTALQSAWNVDKLDGTGKSGVTLDITKDQILYIDFQALYVGRVRFGFVIGGRLIICHEFLNSNTKTSPYIETANLPVFVGMTSAGTVTRTIYFNCCSVISNGGVDETVGYEFSTPDTSVTAGNSTDTHLISLRPRTTFNSITNRVKFASLEIDLIVTGNTPVYWKLCIGQAFSVAPTYANINATYSAFEYGTGGTLSGSPTLVIDSGYIPASASTKGVRNMKITDRYPITLDRAGAVRSLGTLTLLVQGIGATSATRAVLKHKEIR